LRGLLPELTTLEAWNSTTTENVVRHYAEENHLKLGQVAQPLRAALTGRATSPGIFDVFSVLGRDESLARLTDQSL
jgi:glutamyl-tRNA synthetase